MNEAGGAKAPEPWSPPGKEGMAMKRRTVLGMLGMALLPLGTTVAVAGQPPVPWSKSLSQPDDWYGGAEAVRIAENVLAWQRDTGGWPKNKDMAAHLTEGERAGLREDKDQVDSTIDNGSTWRQLRFLARVYAAKPEVQYREAFLKGVDYLLKAQYKNGGWPQIYPLRKGYYTHITFNDGAMIGVLNLLRDIAEKKPGLTFVDDNRRKQCEKAVGKGIDCILRCQISVNGKKTVWCAQHDEKTFAPVPARAYEKISLSGSESVGIVLFLMGIEHPKVEVKEAIEGAVEWFRTARLTGIRYVKRDGDAFVEADPNAPPLWARFYEIGTNRPIFCGRNSIIKYSLAEIEQERRRGYRWYVDSPQDLLDRAYPAWRAGNRPSGDSGDAGS